MVKRARCSSVRQTSNEAGFTLAETLTALLIISLATAIFGQFLTIYLSFEQRLVVEIETSRSVLSELVGQGAETGDIALGSEEFPVTLASDCLYDIVGRRCR